jgi:translation initiation factor IF-3
LRVNREIRAKEVRVIAEDGKQIGILSLQEALKEAEKVGLDLVEISPNAKPPVCKIIDYGKFRYRQTKKEKESKKTQFQVKVKELKFRPNINVHDLKTKVSKIKSFLEKGYKVRLTCMFKGREMLHKDLGRKLLDGIVEELKDIAVVEVPGKLMGRFLTVVIAPIPKKSK